MCIKVIDDLKTTYAKLVEEKPKGKKQDLAETAVTKLCGKKLSTKDNKLVQCCTAGLAEIIVVEMTSCVCNVLMQCYNLEPLKKDVARQVVFKKDSLKICKSLEKKNPDFCSMRYRTYTWQFLDIDCTGLTDCCVLSR